MTQPTKRLHCLIIVYNANEILQSDIYSARCVLMSPDRPPFQARRRRSHVSDQGLINSIDMELIEVSIGGVPSVFRTVHLRPVREISTPPFRRTVKQAISSVTVKTATRHQMPLSKSQTTPRIQKPESPLRWGLHSLNRFSSPSTTAAPSHQTMKSPCHTSTPPKHRPSTTACPCALSCPQCPQTCSRSPRATAAASTGA
jgi:hypothetical protein